MLLDGSSTLQWEIWVVENHPGGFFQCMYVRNIEPNLQLLAWEDSELQPGRVFEHQMVVRTQELVEVSPATQSLDFVGTHLSPSLCTFLKIFWVR